MMTHREPHILIAGGGTGGHVYPAIAIADAVRALAPEARVAFAGTSDRLEANAVPEAGYTLYPITVSGFPRRLSKELLKFPFELFKGFVQSWQLVRGFAPDVVVGTGGYVAGPVLLAARLQGCPLVVQEQNAYPGVTNRLLGWMAVHVHVAFSEAKRYLPSSRCLVSGNPTRAELQSTERAAGRQAFDIPAEARVLLIFGGSLGSRALNEATEASIDTLLQTDDVHVIWQTGARYYDALAERVPPHPRLHLREYIDRMENAYAAADVALCRAGAITCSELMVTGTPSILVPSPNVAADHQAKNAQSMADAGAAEWLPENDVHDRLVEHATALLNDPERRRRMEQAARRIGRPDAAQRIAQDVLRIATARRNRENESRNRLPTKERSPQEGRSEHRNATQSRQEA